MNAHYPDAVCVPCPDYEPARAREALERLLEACGGLDWLKPGMKVGIKANLVAALKPENAATTHPVLLRALVDIIEEKGAQAVVGDSPGGLFNAAFLGRVYQAAGLNAAGLPLNRDYRTRELELPEAKRCKRATVTAWLLDCDAVINFAKLKSHGMMGLSAAAKNLFGTIPGTMKPEYHFRYPNPADFADMLVDLDEFWKPRLHIVDAVLTMEGNGPTAGTPRPMGCLLAGQNPHRLDLLCAKLTGMEPATVPTLRAAMDRGLCPERLEALELEGPWQDFVARDFQIITQRNGFQFQSLMGGGRRGALFSSFLNRCIAARPGVEKAACVGCRRCQEVCPAKAISMKHQKPVIRRRACIRCFCCQEFCPKGAMQVKRPPLARLLER